MVFKALSSKTRLQMLKILMKGERHVSGLAKALNISVPVAAKHVKILEEAELVEREKFGNTHVLRVNKERLYEVMDAFGEEYKIEVRKGVSVLDSLKEIAGVEIKKVGDKEFIASINGEEGFYTYLVDETFPNISVAEYKMEKDAEIEIKRIILVLKKKIKVSVKK
jgi:DNA-binding transcriptional ArsR family regulator